MDRNHDLFELYLFIYLVQKRTLQKMFFHLVTNMGQRENSESLKGIKPQTFGLMLQCSTTESKHYSN